MCHGKELHAFDFCEVPSNFAPPKYFFLAKIGAISDPLESYSLFGPVKKSKLFLTTTQYLRHCVLKISFISARAGVV